jgi:predicted aspartyl protease
MITTVVRENGSDEVGRFSVDVELANSSDLVLARTGHLVPGQVRRATVPAVVDTGATWLMLPPPLVAQLGLSYTGRTVRMKFADGRTADRQQVTGVSVGHQGREVSCDALEEPGRSNVLLGAVVLELLDFLADCRDKRLVPRDPTAIIAEVG